MTTKDFDKLTALDFENGAVRAEIRECVKLANAPVEQLEGSFPVVLYFEDDQGRKEFVEMVRQAKPGMVMKKL